MTGKQLYERARQANLIFGVYKFEELKNYTQAAWNQLAKEASVNVADEFALATHQERNRI